jgi:UDP:flavonoid glycosyltransferase YjiC (YdhE family)
VRFLFVTGGGSATVHASAPLASAARAAGHEVIVACPDENTDLIASLGLPPCGIGATGIVDAMLKDRDGTWLAAPTTAEEELDFVGRGFARLAAAGSPALCTLAEDWRPDVVIGGEYNFAAGLLARRHDLPLVRQTWGIYHPTDDDVAGAAEELAPELSALGLSKLPLETMFVDITPPSLRPSHAPPAQPMRWASGAPQEPLQRWMYVRDARPRVVLTSGSRSAFIPSLGVNFFRPLLDTPLLSDGDVDVVVATTPPVAEQLVERYPHVRAGWLPLDMVARTADVVLHHGGGVTVMALVAAGCPQLVLPEIQFTAGPMTRLDAFGASLTMASHTEPAEHVAVGLSKIIGDPSFRERAGLLRDEVAAMPAAHDVVEAITALL